MRPDPEHRSPMAREPLRLFAELRPHLAVERARELGLAPAFTHLPGETEPIPAHLARFWTTDCIGAAEAAALVDRLVAEEVADEEAIEVAQWRFARDDGPLMGPRRPGPQRHLADRLGGGVGARFAHRFVGGRGEGVKLALIGLDPPMRHDDLQAIEVWGASDLPLSGHHSVAMLGVACGTARGRGVLGVAPEAEPVFVGVRPEHPGQDPFNVLRHAAARLRPPAVLVAPLGVPLVRGLGRGNTDGEWIGSMPLEGWRIARALLIDAAARGITCVVAVGNGSRWLDPDLWQGRGLCDSGSIVVGARDPRSLVPQSDYGMRVDLSSWANGLVSCGGVQGLVTFGGSSGASAIVAGVVASLCGIACAGGRQLTPAEVRDLLVRSGSAVVRGVGPQPDLRLAISELRRGYGVRVELRR